MFDDDNAAAASGLNPQPPSDATQSAAAGDTTRTLQGVPDTNPNMGTRGATDLIAQSANASSIDATPPPSLIPTPATAQALSPTAPLMSAAASATSASQDAPTTAAAATGDTSTTAAEVANMAVPAATTSTMINATTPVSRNSTDTSSDQPTSAPILDPVKQLLGSTQTQAATGSGSTSAVSPAALGPPLGPMLDGPLDVGSVGAPPGDGGITTVHADAGERKASDSSPAAAPTTKSAPPDSASIASMVESGAKAILLSAHDASTAAGNVAGAPAPKSGVVGAPIIAAPSITPDVLVARDQLASAIATANPAAAAITSSPTQGAPAPLVPTLGADTHTLHMHGG